MRPLPVYWKGEDNKVPGKVPCKVETKKEDLSVRKEGPSLNDTFTFTSDDYQAGERGYCRYSSLPMWPKWR